MIPTFVPFYTARDSTPALFPPFRDYVSYIILLALYHVIVIIGDSFLKRVFLIYSVKRSWLGNRISRFSLAVGWVSIGKDCRGC